MGEDGPPGERHDDLDADLFDVRDLRFVLPPLERPPFATKEEKTRAIVRMIRQAERERAAGPDDA
jgi:hypothetical protein